jgi:hypothetical protein
MDREMKTPQIPINAGEAGGNIATTQQRRMSVNGAMTVRHCCSVVADQLLIYKGIATSEMVRRQILSACEPRILGKGAGHDQDPL